MYTLSIQSLQPGMVLYEDTYTPYNQLLFKANTTITGSMIETFESNSIAEVTLAEPNEVNMPRYEHLHKHPHFQRFNDIYLSSVKSFTNILRNLDTGLDFNIPRLLTLKDQVFASIKDNEQLIDYLYNLMPNEDELTFVHCFNCGLLCNVFGQWLGMDGEDLDNLTISGFLFDIGKTKISDKLLWKPDKLTPEEFIEMQHHIHLGYGLLKSRQLPPHVVSVLIMHHERLDGSGYPAGLKGDRIDPFALIAAIADTYEAMTHPRAQRLALTPFQAIRVFEEQGFKKYGPDIKIILTEIANCYAGRNICMTGNITGRIAEIHKDALSRPTVFTGKAYHDLRTTPYTEIIRMV